MWVLKNSGQFGGFRTSKTFAFFGRDRPSLYEAAVRGILLAD